MLKLYSFLQTLQPTIVLPDFKTTKKKRGNTKTKKNTSDQSHFLSGERSGYGVVYSVGFTPIVYMASL